MKYRYGLMSFTFHTFLPLLISSFIAYFLPESFDWVLLAIATSLFALYQYIIDVFIMRDKPPSYEYAEYSLFIVLYSALNALGVI